MAFSTSLNTREIEEKRRQIEAHTAVIIGHITQDNSAFNAVKRIYERCKPAKDADSTIAAIRSYIVNEMGRSIAEDVYTRVLTHSFLSTALDLVDWYGVLSYVTELLEENELDKHPF